MTNHDKQCPRQRARSQAAGTAMVAMLRQGRQAEALEIEPLPNGDDIGC
jgi:hypothetical protein